MKMTSIAIFSIFLLNLNVMCFGISHKVEQQNIGLYKRTDWNMAHGKNLAMKVLEESSNTTSIPPVVNAEKDVWFYLYTRTNRNAYQLDIGNSSSLSGSSFDPTKPTKVAIHGYGKSYLSESVQLIKEAYLNITDVNVIGVDWSVMAQKPWYFWAAHNTHAVGEQVGQMVDWLVSAGAKLKDFHLIGHSLGAHICSFAANNLTSGRLTRITGLDPALPVFGFPLQPDSNRLDSSDADTVDCIHTCGHYLGFYSPLGTHDFYPNGGTFPQPGCSFDILGRCSHLRSVLLFAESVNATFKASSCSSMAELETGSCPHGHKALMGDPAVNWPGGLYFLETNPEFPFAIQNSNSNSNSLIQNTYYLSTFLWILSTLASS